MAFSYTEALKKKIEEFPDKYVLYKRALLCLIDNSKGFSKSVGILIPDSRVAAQLMIAHSELYVSQYEPRLCTFLQSNGFVGRFECGCRDHGKEGFIYWSATGKMLTEFVVIPFDSSV